MSNVYVQVAPLLILAVTAGAGHDYYVNPLQYQVNGNPPVHYRQEHRFYPVV